MEDGDEFVVQALSNQTELYVLDWSVLLPYLAMRPVAVAALLLLLERHREAEIALSDQALHSAPERIWRVLRRCAGDENDHLVEHTLEELGGLASVTLSETSRLVAELQRQGLVQRRGRGRIEIRDAVGVGRQSTETS